MTFNGIEWINKVPQEGNPVHYQEGPLYDSVPGKYLYVVFDRDPAGFFPRTVFLVYVNNTFRVVYATNIKTNLTINSPGFVAPATVGSIGSITYNGNPVYPNGTGQLIITNDYNPSIYMYVSPPDQWKKIS